MNFIAQYRTCDQVGPDDWQMFTRTKQFDESATLKDIYEWRTSKMPPKVKESFVMNDVTIAIPE